MDGKPNQLRKTNSLDKWRCKICEFDNLNLISNCEICDNPRPKEISHSSQKEREEREESKVAVIQCPNKDCKALNALTAEVCTSCRQYLFPDDQQEVKKDKAPKKQLIICKRCNFQNSQENIVCVNCEKRLPKRIRDKSIKPKKARMRMPYGQAPCPKCGEYVRIVNYATGQADDCAACDERQPFTIKKYLCLFCDKKLSEAQQKQHDDVCKQRQKFYSRGKNPTFDRCTDLQYETMIYMHKKCERLHYKKEDAFLKRVEALGYSKEDVENLHHYIINYAPIIIHMHVNTHFHFFLKDTHYRNQFQTSMSSGSLSHSARTGWEDRMFDRKHHSASGFERVKYGTMNFTNDPTGVKVCVGYGQSYFLLKSHVRDRCTITDMDSSSASATLGTFRFIFHLLMKLSDAELKSAFEGSKGKQMLSNVIGAYKQIQIHGPVQFSKDIERVYISKDQLKLGDAKALLEQVKAFCSKNKVDYELFQNIAPAPLFAPHVAEIKAPQRIVGDKKQLTEQDLKPPPPIAPVYGGGFGFGVGFSAFSMAAPAPAFHYSSPLFASSFAVAPKASKAAQKKKQYGVDYI